MNLREHVAGLRTLVEAGPKLTVKTLKVTDGEWRTIYANGFEAVAIAALKLDKYGPPTIRAILPDKTIVPGDWKDLDSAVTDLKAKLKSGEMPLPTPKEGEKPRVPGYALTPEQREYLRNGILKCVQDEYAEYRKRKGMGFSAKEPSISTGFLFDYFNMEVGWGPVQAPTLGMGDARWNKVKRTLVAKIAEQLRKEGKLGSSTGHGKHGREARLYEPAE